MSTSHEYYKMYLATMIEESCFNMAGMKVKFGAAWNPNPKSDILEHVLKVYEGGTQQQTVRYRQFTQVWSALSS